MPPGAVTVSHICQHPTTKPKPEPRPFVAQDGQCLYLVASATRGWIVAELEFDPIACMFVLKRQTEYEWPREALGRLLSRVVSSGMVDDREMERMSEAFTSWLAAQFAA
jgi:hypothetical protein